MEPMQLDILITLFAYSGNGGIASVIPEIATWLAINYHKMAQDPRIKQVWLAQLCDTPITMTRNRAVKMAQEQKCDCLLMIDSDNEPDGYLGKDPSAKPFWDTAFDLLYERKLKGKPTVIAAPYCGPPPHPAKSHQGGELPYLFQWANAESDCPYQHGLNLAMMTRNEAAIMKGIHRVAALPTGVCLFSMDAFEGLEKPYFRYEQSADGAEKWSTEDVVATRNISLYWQNKIGENVVFAACDSWALHHKSKAVGRPVIVSVETVADKFREAVEHGIRSNQRMIDLNPSEPLRESLPDDIQDYSLSDGLVEQEPPEGDVPQTQLAVAQDASGNGDGHPDTSVTYRMIAGRKIASVWHQTADKDLEALGQIVRYTAQRFPDRPLRIVEVGSWVGESALAMHSSLGPMGGIIYCVDTWEGSVNDRLSLVTEMLGPDYVFGWFKKNVGELLNNGIKAVKGDSAEVANSLDKQELDVIFLDAGHSYEEAKRDLQAWFPHLQNEGVFCGHDYCSGFPGVMKAVQEFLGEYHVVPNVVDGTSLWFVSKSSMLRKARAHEQSRFAAQS